MSSRLELGLGLRDVREEKGVIATILDAFGVDWRLKDRFLRLLCFVLFSRLDIDTSFVFSFFFGFYGLKCKHF